MKMQLCYAAETIPCSWLQQASNSVAKSALYLQYQPCLKVVISIPQLAMLAAAAAAKAVEISGTSSSM
jgi:hypothetical protein